MTLAEAITLIATLVPFFGGFFLLASRAQRLQTGSSEGEMAHTAAVWAEEVRWALSAGVLWIALVFAISALASGGPPLAIAAFVGILALIDVAMQPVQRLTMRALAAAVFRTEPASPPCPLWSVAWLVRHVRGSSDVLIRP